MLGLERRSASRLSSSTTTKGRPTETIWGACACITMSRGSSDRHAAAISRDTTLRRDRASGARSSAPTVAPPSRSSVRGTQARGFLEEENSTGGRGRRSTVPRQHERRSDIRMPGEGYFGAGSENSYLGGVRRVFRRQYESGFRIIELEGEGLHLGRREPRGVQDHRQRIPAEHPVGEHIRSHIAPLHGRPRESHSVSERTSLPIRACTAARTALPSYMTR